MAVKVGGVCVGVLASLAKVRAKSTLEPYAPPSYTLSSPKDPSAPVQPMYLAAVRLSTRLTRRPREAVGGLRGLRGMGGMRGMSLGQPVWQPCDHPAPATPPNSYVFARTACREGDARASVCKV